MTKHPQQQIPPIYHRRIGDITVTALSDGVLARTNEMMNDVSKDEGFRHLATAFRKEFLLSINAFLIHSGDRLALVETGSGDYLGSEAGKLFANLASAGISAAGVAGQPQVRGDHGAGARHRSPGLALGIDRS